MKREMVNISMQRYGTRMLKAGDRFEVNRRDARVLHAIKKARYADETVSATDEADHVELTTLRAKYHDLTGKRAFNGWTADQIKEKIAAASSASS